MQAEIVSVGTEILLGQIADTNAQILGKLMPEYGITHRYRQTVGDNLGRLVGSLKLALSRSDIVFTIGGLGPTEDDLTREGVAEALGLQLTVDPDIVSALRELFTKRNLPWLERQERQAMRPIGSTILDNPNGTAPGLYIAREGKHVFLLPGPRGEFAPMVNGPVRAILANLAGSEVIASRILKVVGMGESLVEEHLRALLESSNPSVATYAKPAEVHIRVTALANNREAAFELLQPVTDRVRDLLGLHVFGTDDETLEENLLALLRERHQTVSTAESITGGGVAARLTAVPGSSGVFRGGLVTYQVEAKKDLLGLSHEVVSDPVSESCAREMALACLRNLGTDWAVSTTGNAGPTADAGGKAVGLVYVAVASANKCDVQEFKFRGQRQDIQARATQSALAMLRTRVIR